MSQTKRKERAAPCRGGASFARQTTTRALRAQRWRVKFLSFFLPLSLTFLSLPLLPFLGACGINRRNKKDRPVSLAPGFGTSEWSDGEGDETRGERAFLFSSQWLAPRQTHAPFIPFKSICQPFFSLLPPCSLLSLPFFPSVFGRQASRQGPRAK